MEKKRASQLSVVPQLTIPHILVDNEFGNGIDQFSQGRISGQPRWTQISAGEGASDQTAPSMPNLSLHEVTYQHPLSDPQSPHATSSRQGSTSGFSFELYEPEPHRQSDSRPEGNGNSSPLEARDMLDGSIWTESIRRSATLRQHDQGSYRFGDLR